MYLLIADYLKRTADPQMELPPFSVHYPAQQDNFETSLL